MAESIRSRPAASRSTQGTTMPSASAASEWTSTIGRSSSAAQARAHSSDGPIGPARTETVGTPARRRSSWRSIVRSVRCPSCVVRCVSAGPITHVLSLDFHLLGRRSIACDTLCLFAIAPTVPRRQASDHCYPRTTDQRTKRLLSVQRCAIVHAPGRLGVEFAATLRCRRRIRADRPARRAGRLPSRATARSPEAP